MNKQKFINILSDYRNISDEDRNKLHDLVKSYPYSQILHILIAKANHDAKTEIANHTLHYAAMYVTDRNLLKKIIEDDIPLARVSKSDTLPAQTKTGTKPGLQIKEEIKQPDQKPATTTTKEERKNNVTAEKPAEPKPHNTVSDIEGDMLRDTVINDLQILKKSKAAYMEWAHSHPDSKPQKDTPAKVKSNKTRISKKAAGTKPADNANKKYSERKKTKPSKEGNPVKDGSRKSATTSVSRKKKSEPEPKKAGQKEQNKIIEKFIEKEPRIKAKPGKSPENPSDLSEASSTFNEDLISENLAQILVKQGKKDKAIDIYKKLIWKFPQKKAYFASRIEDLQK